MERLYKQLILDHKLPIPDIPELYEYFFDLYAKTHKTKELLELIQKEVEEFGGFDEFKKMMTDTRIGIIDAISSTPAYALFNDAKNPDFFLPKGTAKFSENTCPISNIRSGSIFNHEFINKRYLSIDLEKANFQMLKHYNKDIVLGANEYEDLVRLFTTSKYFATSKHLRQVIFGNVAGKRQTTIEKYYIGKILTLLLEREYFSKEKVVAVNKDEIIVNIDDDFSDDILAKMYSDILAEFSIRTHIETFFIKEVTKNTFVKEKSDGTVSFKNVPTYYFAQVYKRYFNMPITENDLIFVYEGQKCKFCEPLE